jgi:anthranilate synthase component 1
MKPIQIHTKVRKLLADVYTPVGVYLRLRDRFRDTILLESTDHHAGENSFSFIGVQAIAGIEISQPLRAERKFPLQPAEKINLPAGQPVAPQLWAFMQSFQVDPGGDKMAAFAQGLYGYTSYDAISLMEPAVSAVAQPEIPLMRYRLYQYVIVFDHFRDDLYICENCVEGLPSDADTLLALIRNRDVPQFPFQTIGDEQSNMSDADYLSAIEAGKQHCQRGDVFQIVLSRRYQQAFQGDEFNVYRSLRSINPSPYLFYFDYGDYKLMGSSPESQLLIQQGQATVHPIAGTYRRTGDEQIDAQETARLLVDAKENAEHVMLVDLARNDLSRHGTDVKVSKFREVQYYSHVIHLVSEVCAQVSREANPFTLLGDSFPAGTLSGAPKVKAMQLIREIEPHSRGYYGGTIGFMGFNGACNHAIMIRTLLSKDHRLLYQAGAGVVVASVPELELQEVNHKLGALKKAIVTATTLHQS